MTMSASADLLKQYEHCALYDANEAETRLKIINTILFDILGWEQDDVNVEHRLNDADSTPTYCDYVFHTGSTAFIVEAKRVNRTFRGFPGDTQTYKRLSGILLENDTGAAIKQARDYAINAGIGFAIVTNGSQWIVFPASRTDKVPFSNSHACIFPSLRSVLYTNQRYFMQLLSRDSVISGSLQIELLGHVDTLLENRRLNILFRNRLRSPRRKDLFPSVARAVLDAFTDDLSTSNFLERCYVNTPERTRFDRRIRMYISRPRPQTTRTLSQPDSLGIAIDRASIGYRPTAILILGLVGDGKTTFLNYTRYVTARHRFVHSTSSRYWLYVDFTKCADESETTFIFKSMLQSIDNDTFLINQTSHAYEREFAALEHTLLPMLKDDAKELARHKANILVADRDEVHPYVEKLLSYVSARAPVFLVVDNVDQIPHDDRQSAIFSAAMAIARRLRLTLILSMRSETFAKHRHSSIFNAFDYEPIYIDPPVLQAVLSKRVDAAKAILKEPSTVYEDDVTVDDALLLLKAIRVNVTDYAPFIDVLSNSDVRLALRIVRNLLESGRVITRQVLDTYKRDRRSDIRRHKLLDAIFIGPFTVYSEKLSPVGNPFDARVYDREAQMLRLFILSALVESSHSSAREIDGIEIRDCVRRIGFPDTITEQVLRDLEQLRFCCTLYDEPAMFDASFLPTRLGGYIIRELIADFTALDHFSMDTFIYDNETWLQMKTRMDQIYDAPEIVARTKLKIESVRQFFALMKKCYADLQAMSVKKGLNRQWCSNPLQVLENKFNENIRRTEESVERTYGVAGRFRDDRNVGQ